MFMLTLCIVDSIIHYNWMSPLHYICPREQRRDKPRILRQYKRHPLSEIRELVRYLHAIMRVLRQHHRGVVLIKFPYYCSKNIAVKLFHDYFLHLFKIEILYDDICSYWDGCLIFDYFRK